jgi:lysophospholipase L1-like esterase
MKKILVLLAVVVLASCAGPLTTDYVKAGYVVPSRDVGGSGKPTLLLAGDSRVQAFPVTILSDYFDVTNIGLGGTTSYETAYAIQAETTRYDYIIISVGINDMARGAKVYDTVMNLGACVAQAKAKADKVFITTIPGINPCPAFPYSFAFDGSCRAAQVNSFIPTIASNYGVEWIPLHWAMNSGIFLKAQYDDGSGIHYNLAGYEVIYDLYMQALGE